MNNYLYFFSIIGLIITKKWLFSTYQFKQTKKQAYIIMILYCFWPLTNYHLPYLLLILAAIFLVLSLPKWREVIRKQNYVHALKYEFPIWLRQLQILLQNNNVLHALKLSHEYAPALIKPALISLIENVSDNSMESTSFTAFLADYEIYEIQKVMRLLYRYHTMGNKDAYYQLQKMLEITGKWLRSERLKKQEGKIAILSWIGMVPLFGVTILFMIMMVQIINMMMKGGM